MENSKLSAAGLKSVLAAALGIALLSGGLLWALRPHTDAEKVVGLLIRVSSGSQGRRLAVMNGSPGAFSIDLSGGQVNAGATTDVHIRSHYSGSLSQLTLDEILKSGEWMSPTGDGSVLPSANHPLPPGDYVIEITGTGQNGFIYAGAQAFHQ